MNFDLWRRWGIDLDDVSFANAWIALGVAQRLQWPNMGPVSVHQLEQASFNHSIVEWLYPFRNREPEGTPEEWAHAWRVVSERIPKPIRLRIFFASPNELIHPWYGALSKADPAPSAVSLMYPQPRAQLHIGWPLRLGCISDNSWNIIEQVREKWPSSKVTRGVRLDRITSNCDVLIEKSSVRELLQQLLQQPFSIKANIIVLQGGDEAVFGELDALLRSVLTLLRASGFILVPPKMDDTGLINFVNELVWQLTHDHPLDVAFGESMRMTNSQDVVAAFTDEIMPFAIHDLVDRYNTQLMALPKGTTLDMSHVGESHEWLTHGMRGGGMRGGEVKSVPTSDADRHVPADTVRIEETITYARESEGGSALAEVSESLKTASVPPGELAARAARFLQQRSFVRLNSEFQEATSGFIANNPAMIRVRIAAPEEGWDSLPTAFPVEKLPQHLKSWKLTVWLSEPDHLPVALKGRITLPRDGNSTEWEFNFRPLDFERFNGRLTVLYRGRIIQTAVLRAGVRRDINSFVEDATPKLDDLVAVRNRVGDLDERRQFDIAFVANHDDKGRPLLTGVSENAAWVKDLTKIVAVAGQINESLVPVAMSVDDYADGLQGDNGRKLLIELAGHGAWLKLRFDEQFKDANNNLATTEQEFIQIVSTRSDSVVPLEFVYQHQAPEDDAAVCPHWLNAAKNRETLEKCPGTCDTTSGRIVCPLGFWGLQKVIERHAVTPGLAQNGNVLFLQSEPTRESDTLYMGGVTVVGSSNNVPENNVTELENLIKQHSGVEPKLASNWSDWEVQVQEHRPNLLIALPHADGKESSVTLEIGGEAKRTITFRQTHVFPPPVEGRQAPLVALIGCDTTGTASEYGDHVVCFRDRGAGIVIGTIATVFGPHAAKVAGKLVEGLLKSDEGKPVRLGELMRTIRRDSLRDGLLMPLCLVAYGDADWILSPEKSDDD